MTGPPDGDPDTTEAGVEATDWRRLDTRMLLVNPVQELIRFFPLVIGAFVVGSSGGQDYWQLVGVAIPVVIGVMRFVVTRFRITPTQVELKRGFIGQSVLTARLDRVRTVELTSSPIHRLLGLARVEIGTGSAVQQLEERFALDSLALPEARRLRAALLHRVQGPPIEEPVDDASAPGAVPAPSGMPGGPAESVLVRLDPGWVRYAPLTASGSVVAAGVLALLGQLGDRVLGRLLDGEALAERLLQLSAALLVVGGVVAFLVLGAAFAVLGYLVNNWGFTLSRDTTGRSYHVRRGLLTSTETSMESARIRGVEVAEPLGLRLAGAGRGLAVVTGLSARESASRVVVPPAPIGVVRRTAAEVLGDLEPVVVPLVPHGPAARRRRFTRALLGGTALPAVGLGAAALTPAPWPVVLPLLLVYPAAALLAADRYRRLGHALTADHLVVQSGSLAGRRDVLQRSGIISWNIRQTWFQRRAGLVDLVATTAAGGQAYVAPDIPEPQAVALAGEAVPGLVDQFLVTSPS